jgi:multidrug efflux pump subunit AcrA (membrane-fusion protein)
MSFCLPNGLDLITRLRALARSLHSDVSTADEAADELARRDAEQDVYAEEARKSLELIDRLATLNSALVDKCNRGTIQNARLDEEIIRLAAEARALDADNIRLRAELAEARAYRAQDQAELAALRAGDPAMPVVAHVLWRESGGFYSQCHIDCVGGEPAVLRSDALAAIAAERADAERLRVALRFYARGQHYNLDDSEDFDSVSGEPRNWLCSGLDDSTTMIEDGEVARFALRGEPINWICLLYTSDAADDM